MNLAIKIEATGNLQGLSTDCDTAFTAVVSEDDFKDALGKALYSVESQGYDFTTSDVYDEAVKGFEGISLRRQFQKIYISPQVNVSVKIA